MGAKTLLSLEEYMSLPDDGNRYELNQGELVLMPPPKPEHDYILDNVKMILSTFVSGKRIGRIYGQAGYLLTREPEATIRQPDVSFLSRGRVKRSGGYVEGSPELAVEIVSPSDSAEELRLKVKQYLAFGSHAVWVFYPKTRSVDLHKQGGSVSLSDADSLSTDLFPGWSARVADFFDFDY